MRVLHVSPLWFPVSCDAPGGIESFLSHLLPSLTAEGCEVALVASGDSVVPCQLFAAVPRNLFDEMAAGRASEYAYYEQHQLMTAAENAPDFDVVHCHSVTAAYVLSCMIGCRTGVLHTQHTPVTPDLRWFLARHRDVWVSTVSRFQAERLDRKERCAVIPNGVPVGEFPFRANSGPRLVFVGRIEPVKGADAAIRVARELGRPLVLAGPITDEHFFRCAVLPWLGEEIRYAGVARQRQKQRLLAHAACLLMPSRQDEAFGVIAIEAMSCGTPVVALANGALSEIVDLGITGYVTNDEQELARLVRDAFALDRDGIRRRVAERFDIGVVARRYRALYHRMVA